MGDYYVLPSFSIVLLRVNDSFIFCGLFCHFLLFYSSVSFFHLFAVIVVLSISKILEIKNKHASYRPASVCQALQRVWNLN